MNAHCGPIKRMAQGGMIRGPGTGTSDSITAQMPPGTFIQPADTTVRVSNGEAAFTPKEEQAVGQAVLEVLRQLTHTPTGAKGKGKAGPFVRAAMRNGGAIPGYADGGEIDDKRLPTFASPDAAAQALVGMGGRAAQAPGAEPITPITPPNGQGAIADAAAGAAGAPPSTGPLPVITPGQVSAMSARARAAAAAGVPPIIPGASASSDLPSGEMALAARGANEAVQSALAEGDYSAALGHAVRGGLGIIGGVGADVVNAVAPAANAVGRTAYVAATGDDARAPAARGPIATAAAANQQGTNRQALQGGGTESPPAPMLNGGTGTLVQGADGVYRLTTEGGGTLYSNVPGDNGAAAAPAGPISRQNMAAADALDTRYLGEALAANASPPAAPPASYIPGVTAPLTQYERDTAARNAGVVSSLNRQIGATEQAHMDNQRAIEGDRSATSRANTAATVAVSARGQDLNNANTQGQQAIEARRLAQAQPLTTAQTERETTQNKGAIQQMQATQAYLAAVKSGDPKAIAAAERVLRAFKGAVPQRHLVVPGGQTTNDMGQAITQPSMVFDQETGTFIRPPGAGANAMPPGMIRQAGTSGGKPVYEDAKGNRFIGD